MHWITPGTETQSIASAQRVVIARLLLEITKREQKQTYHQAPKPYRRPESGKHTHPTGAAAFTPLFAAHRRLAQQLHFMHLKVGPILEQRLFDLE